MSAKFVEGDVVTRDYGPVELGRVVALNDVSEEVLVRWDATGNIIRYWDWSLRKVTEDDAGRILSK